VATLDRREREVVESRFGLTGERPRTLEEVGRTLGVTRERVRQLQDRATRKLRYAFLKWEESLSTQPV
jgi:RNA polymerase primary sigma factor